MQHYTVLAEWKTLAAASTAKKKVATHRKPRLTENTAARYLTRCPHEAISRATNNMRFSSSNACSEVRAPSLTGAYREGLQIQGKVAQKWSTWNCQMPVSQS